MDYNLTDKQKAVITWLVEANRNGELDDEFSMAWYLGGGQMLVGRNGVEPSGGQPEITPVFLMRWKRRILYCKKSSTRLEQNS